MREQTIRAIQELEEEKIDAIQDYNYKRAKEIDKEIDILKESETNKDTEEKQLQIIEHYGEDHQLDKLIEELAELIQAICKWKQNYLSENSIDYLENLLEEMADVTNLIEQFSLSDKYIADRIEEYKTEKVDRELKRIKNE